MNLEFVKVGASELNVDILTVGKATKVFREFVNMFPLVVFGAGKHIGYMEVVRATLTRCPAAKVYPAVRRETVILYTLEIVSGAGLLALSETS